MWSLHLAQHCLKIPWLRNNLSFLLSFFLKICLSWSKKKIFAVQDGASFSFSVSGVLSDFNQHWSNMIWNSWGWLKCPFKKKKRHLRLKLLELPIDSPCPRLHVPSRATIVDYEFTLKAFQCPAEFSQQFESPVNHNTASSWLSTKKEMNSGTDNPKQKNNQNVSYILLWNALYGFWGFRFSFPVMFCSGKSWNEFAFPKPTQNSWGGMWLGHMLGGREKAAWNLRGENSTDKSRSGKFPYE